MHALMRKLIVSFQEIRQAFHPKLNNHMPSITGIPNLWITSMKLDAENRVGKISRPKFFFSKVHHFTQPRC